MPFDNPAEDKRKAKKKKEAALKGKSIGGSSHAGDSSNRNAVLTSFLKTKRKNKSKKK